jgi:energy-coupling factor transporter ATP-binding protein EcfA2
VLSGGERRRVEIGRTLCTRPSFILLDEPFTGVDPIAIDDIRTIIADLVSRTRSAILITDHNVRETLEICDRAYIISEGKIRTHGPAKELPDDPIARRTTWASASGCSWSSGSAATVRVSSSVGWQGSCRPRKRRSGATFPAAAGGVEKSSPSWRSTRRLPPFAVPDSIADCRLPFPSML